MTLKAFKNLIAKYPELELKYEDGWYNVYHTSMAGKILCYYATGYEMAHLITSFLIIYSSYNRQFDFNKNRSIDVKDINKAKKILDNSLNDLNKLILMKKEFENNLNELSVKEDFE